MTSISRQNIFSRSIYELFETLSKYKQLITSFRANANCQSIQTQFKFRITLNQEQKISNDLLGIYLYLEEKEQYQIKRLLEEFIQIFKELNEIFRQSNKEKKISEKNLSKSIMCSKCKSLVQKIMLNKIKESLGFTQGCTSTQTQIMSTDGVQLKKFNRTSQYHDDFQQKQKLHISNLETHITTLMNIIENQYQSKTMTILRKQSQTFKNTEMDFKQNTNIVKQNQKTVMEAEIFFKKFNQNFIKTLRGPIQSTVKKILNLIQQKKQYQQNSLLKPIQTQTFISIQNQSQNYYEKKCIQLQNELKKIRQNKMENDRNTLKSVSLENQLKKQLQIAHQSKLLLEQRFKQAQQNYNFLEGKLHVQIVIKGKQIAKLEKRIAELKQQLTDKGTIPRIQASTSKKSIAFSKGKSGMLSKREVDRQIKTNLNNPRPSLDLNIDVDQMQNNALIRFSHKKNQKRQIRNSKMNEINFDDSKKNSKTVVQFKEDSSIYRRTQQFSQITEHRNLNICTQINIKIQPFQYQFEEAHLKRANLKISRPNRDQSKKNLTIKITDQMHLIQSKNEKLNKTQTDNLYQINETLKNAQHLQGKKHNQNKKITFPTNNGYRVQNPRLKTEMQKQNRKNRLIQNISTGQINSKAAHVKKTRQFTKKQDQNNLSLLPDIKQQYLSLFGGEKHAQQFEKNSGIWPHLVNNDKLIVDCENSNFASQIHKHFLFLYQNKDPKVYDYITFLLQPYTYFRKNNYIELQKINPSEFDLGNIKILFVQLIRFHKLMHRNCNHVFQFLDSIGFFSI